MQRGSLAAACAAALVAVLAAAAPAAAEECGWRAANATCSSPSACCNVYVRHD